MELDRRDFLKLSGALTFTIAAGGCATSAPNTMLKPKFAIPFHYGTFPVLKGTPQEYQQHLGQTATQVFPISPGDKLTF